MEHVERQDEREAELRGETDDLERQGDELEQEGERVDQQIDDVRDEFERKKESTDVPGAQDLEWESTGSTPGDAGGAPQEDEAPRPDDE